MTHAPLGAAFLSAATHVFRCCPERVEALDVHPDQDTADVREQARAALARLDDGSGVLIMTDAMGGTPSNCTNSIAAPGMVEVIAGLSLPMLLRALTYRNDTLEVATEMALAGGQAGVVRLDHRIPLSVS